MDFLVDNEKEYFQKVDYTLRPIQEHAVWDGVLRKDSLWAYATETSYKETLRRTMDNWNECKKTAEELSVILSKNFSDEKLYKNFCESIYCPSEEEQEWLSELSKIEVL